MLIIYVALFVQLTALSANHQYFPIEYLCISTITFIQTREIYNAAHMI